LATPGMEISQVERVVLCLSDVDGRVVACANLELDDRDGLSRKEDGVKALLKPENWELEQNSPGEAPRVCHGNCS
jgi:hypothetical protein